LATSPHNTKKTGIPQPTKMKKLFNCLSVAVLSFGIVHATSTPVIAAPKPCRTGVLDSAPSAETREISADAIDFYVLFNIPRNYRTIAHTDSGAIEILDPDMYQYLECNGELGHGALDAGSVWFFPSEVNTLREGTWYCGISATFCNNSTEIVASSQGQLADGRGWGLVEIRSGFDGGLMYVGALSTLEGGSFVVSMPTPASEKLLPVFDMIISSVHSVYE
jgi:hypothetical protein